MWSAVRDAIPEGAGPRKLKQDWVKASIGNDSTLVSFCKQLLIGYSKGLVFEWRAGNGGRRATCTADLRMSTAEKRPPLTIRQAQEADAAAVREIFNEAIEDRLGTFDAVPRSLQEQRRLILAEPGRNRSLRQSQLRKKTLFLFSASATNFEYEITSK